MVGGASTNKRLIGLGVLLFIVAGGLGLLFGTHAGQMLLHDPLRFGNNVRALVKRHPVITPTIFISVYVILAVLAQPLWWMDVLAGYGFGVLGGIACSEIGGTLGSIGATLLARWLVADWFRQRVEKRIEKLRKLDQKLDHNGFLVVMAVRLSHVVPVGISNYVFGVIGISLADVAVGTFLGSIPANTLSATFGANAREMATSAFIAMMIVMHVLLLIPLVLRYLRPAWFKRIGVE